MSLYSPPWESSHNSAPTPSSCEFSNWECPAWKPEACLPIAGKSVWNQQFEALWIVFLQWIASSVLGKTTEANLDKRELCSRALW